MAYHKSDSSHSLSFVFSILLECKYPPEAQIFLWISKYHTKGIQNWFSTWPPNIFHRKCCEIHGELYLLLGNLETKEWSFLGQGEKQTNKQTNPWGLGALFLVQTSISSLCFHGHIFFLSISLLRILPLWDLLTYQYIGSLCQKNILHCCCISVDHSAHLLSHCTSQDMNHSTIKYFRVPYIKRNHGIPNPFVPSNLHWKCICNRRGGFKSFSKHKPWYRVQQVVHKEQTLSVSGAWKQNAALKLSAAQGESGGAVPWLTFQGESRHLRASVVGRKHWNKQPHQTAQWRRGSCRCKLSVSDFVWGTMILFWLGAPKTQQLALYRAPNDKTNSKRQSYHYAYHFMYNICLGWDLLLMASLVSKERVKIDLLWQSIKYFC